MDAETFYKSRAASLITERREQLELTYKELARRLEVLGIEVDAKQLAKRINRGTLPFHLAMAIFEALEVSELKLPRLSRSPRR